MADTETTNLKLTIQTIGGNPNTWGQKLNDNFDRIDDKLGNMTSVSTSGGNTSLSESEEEVNAVKVTGTLGSAASLTFSGRGGLWVIWNATTGDFSLTAKCSGQTGVTIAQGKKTLVWCDGTDIIKAYDETDTASLVAKNTYDAAAEVQVASAATCNVLGAASLFVEVTGSTGPITSFGTGTNRLRIIRFASTPTVTHHATTLVLPTGANITVAAGDTWIIKSDGSSNVRVVAILKANGAPLSLPAAGSFSTSVTAPAVTSSGTLALTGTISPSQITGNQNNYAPTGHGTAAVFRLSSDASRDITGIAGGADGRIVFLWNVGSFPIVLKNASNDSDAGNRFALAEDVTIGAAAGAIIQYDSTSSRWRCLGTVGGTLVAATASEIWIGTATGKAITPAGLTNALATVDLGDISGSVSLDFHTFRHAKARLTGNVTFTPTNYTAIGSASGTISLLQDGTGGRTMNMTSSALVSQNGTDLVLSTAAGTLDRIYWQVADNNGTKKVDFSLMRNVG